MNYKKTLFCIISLFSCFLPGIISASADDQQEQEQLTRFLFYSIANGNETGVRHLINRGVDLNKSFGAHNDTPLIFAIRSLAVLITNYNNKIFTDPFTTKLAIETRLSIIRLIIFKPETNYLAANDEGETALSLATQEGLKEVIDFILMRMQFATVQASDTATDHYRNLLAHFDVSDDIRAKISQAISKLENAVHPSDQGKFDEWVKFIFELDWSSGKTNQVSLNEVKDALNKNHYGMKKAKDEILNFLAIESLLEQQESAEQTQDEESKKKTRKGKVLCLVGPPGTGKTSIAKSIAHALKKDVARVSLGGIHDESEIRGHKKAYLGADPGRILKELKHKSRTNTVIILDEIDKMGNSVSNGSPVSALLEVLDPEQNKEFVDHYLDIPYDLSEILFIATANDASEIPVTLADRLTIIKLPSYTFEEKFEIAKRHIVPKVLVDTGTGKLGLSFSDDLLKYIIKSYTLEPGVRNLEKKIRTLCERAARAFLETQVIPVFTLENLAEYLGGGIDPDVEKVFLKENHVGVANGLVYSYVGGSVLVIETALVPCKPEQGKLKITGQLHNVMQESAQIAYTYMQSHAQELGISTDKFLNYDIHIHCPDGATPKDGPSAGVAFLSAITSLLTNRPFDASFAMTGELSLTGHVLPIGGLREKLTSAKRLGINKVIIPFANKSDLVEIKDLIDGMDIIPVKQAQEVLNLVLLPSKK